MAFLNKTLTEDELVEMFFIGLLSKIERIIETIKSLAGGLNAAFRRVTNVRPSGVQKNL